MRTNLNIILITLAFAGTNCQAQPEMTYNTLTPEEEHVLLNKGTEKPHSGLYVNYNAKGVYTCKRCDAPLYKSEDKFDSHCGWPSFDDEIPGAVRREKDSDGRRIEILCNNCGGHLGHVFLNEGFTPKNVRHCVNSISMNFIPDTADVNSARAIFAAGCFWGVEYHFQLVPGVLSTTVGYTGGRSAEPTYKEVCNKSTGHAEAVEVIFDPDKVTFEDLARLFFEIHDPTQVDRQGPDIGEQYRSAIYYHDESQRQTIQKLIKILEKKGLDVVTEITPAGKFWPAEDYHQDYYESRSSTPYCHIYTKRF